MAHGRFGALVIAGSVVGLANAAGCTFGALTMADPPEDAGTGSEGSESTSGDPPDFGSTTDDDTGGTTGAALGDSSDDSAMTTSGGEDPADDTTTGPDVECIDDLDCPEGFVCRAAVCINPAEGSVCDEPSDCDPSAPLCDTGQCWDGSPGDPCTDLGVCAIGVACGPQGQCQAGDEGDPCDSAADCSAQAPFCGDDLMCHDGSVGDSCASTSGCDIGLLCGPEAMCQPGVEGDPCLQDQGHCSLLAPFCPQNDDLCHDGSIGDPCDSAAQCMAGVYCNPDGHCQAGVEGDLCVANGDDCGPQAPFCVVASCWNGSVGDSCQTDAECAFPLHCNEAQQCQVGFEGEPCVVNGNDCSLALAPFCGPDLMCHDGDVGDPCTSGGCAKGNDCTDGLCA